MNSDHRDTQNILFQCPSLICPDLFTPSVFVSSSLLSPSRDMHMGSRHLQTISLPFRTYSPLRCTRQNRGDGHKGFRSESANLLLTRLILLLLYRDPVASGTKAKLAMSHKSRDRHRKFPPGSLALVQTRC